MLILAHDLSPHLRNCGTNGKLAIVRPAHRIISRRNVERDFSNGVIWNFFQTQFEKREVSILSVFDGVQTPSR